MAGFTYYNYPFDVTTTAPGVNVMQCLVSDYASGNRCTFVHEFDQASLTYEDTAPVAFTHLCAGHTFPAE